VASGWAKDGAVQEQIDDTVEDALQSLRSRLPAGEGLAHCEKCGDEIPAARRAALKGVRLCIACQRERDKDAAPFTGYNRRGSKHSQMR